MKRLVFLATAAGLFLVSNAPPPGPPSARDGYPPCSARMTDNCVQRVRGEPESRALDAMPPEEVSGAPDGSYDGPPAPPPPPRAMAAGRTYPRCSASITDSCVQGQGGYRHPIRHARRVRHAGERG
jgi:hypothetical protein